MKFDQIKQFFIKYKRYFGAVVLFVFLVLVLAMCTGPEEETEDSGKDGTEPATVESEDVSDNVSTEAEVDLSGTVEKTDNAEVTGLIQSYYKAYADNDVGTLEGIVSLLTDNEKSYIATFSEYYEEYQNIECYALALNENEYFVSACYDLKFYEADTPAPGMDFFYLERNDAGNLYINSAYTTYNFTFMEQPLDANIYANIIAYEEKDEVTALQQDVQSRYDEAVASDEKLANLVGGTLRNAMTQWRDKITAGSTEATEQTTENTEDTSPQEDTEKPSENEEPENGADTGTSEAEEPEDDGTFTVKTLDVCNVRASASTDGELLGRVSAGVKLTALGTEGDWTKVEFQGGTGYIRSDLLKKVKS